MLGDRYHLDAVCGACKGPLEVERDAICCRCTDRDKLRWAREERDDADARSTAVEAALRTARKNAREQYGMTLRTFAKFCGATASDISKWTADPIEGEPDIVCRR
jgi:hypothetical protein